MSLVDNIDKVAFSSKYPVDKIIWESSLETNTLAADTTTSWSIVHLQGPDVVVTGVFSLDGTNFYPFGSDIFGSALGSDIGPQFVRMDAYCDDSVVYFRALSFFDTPQSASYYYWLESIS